MRQAGVIVAAGIVALEKMVDRLAEDHKRARVLADRLQGIPGLIFELERPPTNMIYVQFTKDAPINAPELAQMCSEKGIKLNALDPHRMRLVVHYWIDDHAVETVASTFEQAFKLD